MFLDFVEIHVRAGDGGNGAVAFRREKYVPRGGPAGGNGGRGGDVRLVVDPGLTTLSPYRYHHHFRAGSGQHGSGNERRGANGEDLALPVPPGTVVREKASGRLLGELLRPGETLVVARGGRGGRGNAAFRSSVERTPRFAERGEPGEERWLTLELKLLADVGLVGLPNAGKSSLLARLTAARPKVGDYAFTTLTPELGVVLRPEGSFVVADLPGLIEGAAEGKGLGHRFLKHAERTRLLVHVVDAGRPDVTMLLQDIETVRKELSEYDPGLLDRALVLALNKVDLPGARERSEEVRVRLKDLYRFVLPVSAHEGSGIEELVQAMLEGLAERPRLEVEGMRGAVEHSPSGPPFLVMAVGQGFRVEGADVERRVAMTDLENPEALRRLQRYLRRIGVERALRQKGAQPGDTVYIRDQEFQYWPEGGVGEGVDSRRDE